MKHPEQLISHLIEEHGLKPWSIAGAAEEQHRSLHARDYFRPCGHTHDEADDFGRHAHPGSAGSYDSTGPEVAP